MNTKKFRTTGKNSITLSTYKFEFNGQATNWTKLLSNLGNQLDELEVKISEVSKVELDGDMVTLTCLNAYSVKDGKLEKVF